MDKLQACAADGCSVGVPVWPRRGHWRRARRRPGASAGSVDRRTARPFAPRRGPASADRPSKARGRGEQAPQGPREPSPSHSPRSRRGLDSSPCAAAATGHPGVPCSRKSCSATRCPETGLATCTGRTRSRGGQVLQHLLLGNLDRERRRFGEAQRFGPLPKRIAVIAVAENQEPHAAAFEKQRGVEQGLEAVPAPERPNVSADEVADGCPAGSSSVGRMGHDQSSSRRFRWAPAPAWPVRRRGWTMPCPNALRSAPPARPPARRGTVRPASMRRTNEPRLSPPATICRFRPEVANFEDEPRPLEEGHQASPRRQSSAASRTRRRRPRGGIVSALIVAPGRVREKVHDSPRVAAANAIVGRDPNDRDPGRRHGGRRDRARVLWFRLPASIVTRCPEAAQCPANS